MYPLLPIDTNICQTISASQYEAQTASDRSIEEHSAQEILFQSTCPVL